MPGTLTRDQLVTEICDVVGKSGNALAVSGSTLTSRVQTYLNWAQRRVARYWNWHELVARQDSAATVATVKKYPLETGTNNLGLSRTKDIISITLIDGANSRTLKRIPSQAYFKRFPYPENYAQSRPWVYIRYGQNLEFFQIPNAIYTMQILYSQWPTDFSTGSQTSDFDYKDELLVTAGVFETYLALEEYQDASTWMAKLKGQLVDASSVDIDSDMEWTALPFSQGPDIMSGTPWTEPGGSQMDPLYSNPDEGGIMSVRERQCITNIWSATSTTIAGPISFVGIVALGSAALGTLQVSDGTKNIFNIGVNITAPGGYAPAFPIAISSALIITVISTAGYSVTYMPRP